MIGRRGRIDAAVWAFCLVAALSGCASVPTGGPTFEGRGDRFGNQVDTFTRLLPAGPQPGWGENTLVRGFLKDMGSFEENHEAARLYMTEEQSRVWEPSDQVLVYEEMDAVRFDVETVEEGRTAQVRVRTPLYATIRSDGQYVAAEQGQTIDVVFHLTKEDDEWRIDDLPDDILLSRQDVNRVYRPLNLYYFNQDLSTLVPDPVFLPVHSAVGITEQLAQRLVGMLVEGATDWLTPAVRTSFPEGTTASVAYSSGNVTVNLDSPRASAADSERLFGMGAQLVWTLKQLPEIQEFTLLINGEEVELPGVEDGILQASSQEWNSVNPAGMTGSPRAYFVRDGQLWSLDVDGQEALAPGAAGQGHVLLEEHAVSLDEERVAGISPDDGSVRVARLAAGSEYATVLEGGDYVALSWDGYGNLWVLEALSAEVEEVQQEEALDDDTEPGDTGAEQSGRSAEAEETGRSRLWLLPRRSRPGRGPRAGTVGGPGRRAAGLQGRHPRRGPDRDLRHRQGAGRPCRPRRVGGVPPGLPAPGHRPGHRHRPVLARRRPVGGPGAEGPRRDTGLPGSAQRERGVHQRGRGDGRRHEDHHRGSRHAPAVGHRGGHRLLLQRPPHVEPRGRGHQPGLPGLTPKGAGTPEGFPQAEGPCGDVPRRGRTVEAWRFSRSSPDGRRRWATWCWSSGAPDAASAERWCARRARRRSTRGRGAVGPGGAARRSGRWAPTPDEAARSCWPSRTVDAGHSGSGWPADWPARCGRRRPRRGGSGWSPFPDGPRPPGSGATTRCGH
ncbi:hypothetical protein ABH917_004804 [Thermobifida halotolerans]